MWVCFNKLRSRVLTTIWRQKVRPWAQTRQDIETETFTSSQNSQRSTLSVRGALGKFLLITKKVRTLVPLTLTLCICYLPLYHNKYPELCGLKQQWLLFSNLSHSCSCHQMAAGTAGRFKMISLRGLEPGCWTSSMWPSSSRLDQVFLHLCSGQPCIMAWPCFQPSPAPCLLPSTQAFSYEIPAQLIPSWCLPLGGPGLTH